jgi:uncharacterized protein DUF4149
MKTLVLVACCLEILALSVWIGALVGIMAAVIPAVFNTTGMEVGGRLLTRAFQGYDRLVLISVVVIMVGMLTRVMVSKIGMTAVSWREQVTRVEILLLTAMVVIAGYLTFSLNPHIVGLQERAFMAKDQALKQMAYQDFFFGHYLARALYLINLGLAIITLCVKVRKWVR